MRSNTLAGAASPSMDQWNTAVFVTMPSIEGPIQVQNTTLSGIWCDFILLAIPMLKIAGDPAPRPRQSRGAITFDTGFISALSAVMGLREDGSKVGKGTRWVACQKHERSEGRKARLSKGKRKGAFCAPKNVARLPRARNPRGGRARSVRARCGGRHAWCGVAHAHARGGCARGVVRVRDTPRAFASRA